MTAESPFFKNDEDALRTTTASNAPILYLPSGSTTVRVLPTWKEGAAYFKTFREHYFKVDGQHQYLTCTEDDNCPGCEEVDRLSSLGDEQSLEAADSLDARRKFFFNVVLISEPAGDSQLKKGEVYVMKVPSSVRNAIVKMDRDESGDWYDVTDPFRGVALRITKEGTGKMGTKYSVLPAGARTDLVELLASIGVDKTLEQLHQEMHNLDDVFPPRDYEDAKRLLAKAHRRTQRTQRPATEVPISAPTPAAAPRPVAAPMPPPRPAPAPIAPPPAPKVTEE